MRAWSVVAVLAIVLAGCADKRGGTECDAVQLGDGSCVELQDVPPPASGKGAISGVVVDDAIRPLAGVNITVLNLLKTAVTDATGLFVIADMEPGLYTLTASAVGYTGTQTTAEVVAGDTAKVRIVLPIDRTPKPYHTTYKFDAYDEVTLGVVDGGYDILTNGGPLNGTLPPLCDQCHFFIHPEGRVETFLLEAVWEDSIEDPTGGTEYYFSLEDPDSSDYEDDYCSSPCRYPIPGATFANATTLRLDMYPDENWVAYQQTWTIFLTLWYLAPAPDDWSFVAGDT